MATFGTVEVYEEMARALNDSAEWAIVGADLSIRVAFEYSAPVDRTFALVFDHGRITQVTEIDDASEYQLDYTIRASPKTWRGILTGGKSPMVAITTGKLKIDGDLAGLLKHMSAFNALLDAMSAVELT